MMLHAKEMCVTHSAGHTHFFFLKGRHSTNERTKKDRERKKSKYLGLLGLLPGSDITSHVLLSKTPAYMKRRYKHRLQRKKKEWKKNIIGN